LRVVLVHGLFGSASASWGLLPLLLALEEDVDVVEVVTYPHGLWLGHRRFEDLVEQFRHVVTHLLENPEEEVAIFGHSMGGLLSLRAVLDMHGEAALIRLRALTLVGSPMRGSLVALLTFPFVWARKLAPGAPFLRKLLTDYTHQYPPPCHRVGEDAYSPTLNILYGNNDPIAGGRSEFAGLPAVNVGDLAGTHSDINFIFDPQSRAVRDYARMYRAANRSVMLMRMLAATLSGRRLPRRRAIFECPPDGGFERARVIAVEDLPWGSVLSGFSRLDDEGRSLGNWCADELRELVPEVAELSHRLGAAVRRAIDDGGMVAWREPTSDGRDLEIMVYANRFAGLVLAIGPA
jgi:pimeloyl-ACP methyl ester carboxylesterase